MSLQYISPAVGNAARRHLSVAHRITNTILWQRRHPGEEWYFRLHLYDNVMSLMYQPVASRLKNMIGCVENNLSATLRRVGINMNCGLAAKFFWINCAITLFARNIIPTYELLVSDRPVRRIVTSFLVLNGSLLYLLYRNYSDVIWELWPQITRKSNICSTAWSSWRKRTHHNSALQVTLPTNRGRYAEIVSMQWRYHE